MTQGPGRWQASPLILPPASSPSMSICMRIGAMLAIVLESYDPLQGLIGTIELISGIVQVLPDLLRAVD